jgi:hypothetical protein
MIEIQNEVGVEVLEVFTQTKDLRIIYEFLHRNEVDNEEFNETQV